MLNKSKKIAVNALSDGTKLDVILEIQENPHNSLGEEAPLFTVSHSLIFRTLKKSKIHHYI